MSWYAASDESAAITTTLPNRSPARQRLCRDEMQAVEHGVTSRSVEGQGDGFQMVGPDAGTDPAQVVNLGTLWDRTDPEFVGVSVGLCLLPLPIALDGEEPIAVWFKSSAPEPAGFGIDENHVEEALLFGAPLGSMQYRTRHRYQGRWSQ